MNKSAKRTVKEFKKVFSHFRESDQKIIYSSLPPCSFPEYNDEIELFGEMLKEKLNALQIENYSFCDFFTLLVDKKNNVLRKEFDVGDGVHLNSSGYKVLGENLAGCFF